ncbi:MAG TPA: S-methyl-5-thioribose-1-phosphate isomerase [Polyangiaceae bacterium]|nr:S-methyl-5-thioribose-1-phosphate isomerase [Polyangiaceae bacterium]
MTALPHPDPISGASYSAVELSPGNREVVLLDQRRLPSAEEYLRLRSVEEVARAIEQLAVRGAPAIGIAAAYGVVVAAAEGSGVAAAIERLRRTRPTAVNLAWALERMARVGADLEALAREARAIHREDVAACRAMGQLGAQFVPDGATVLTHCNAGALATGGYGTALGVVRAARESGKRVRVVACETRPVLQGARLTAWELARDGIDVTLVTDSMVAQLLRAGGADLAVVGADRIARSGDVANKIGTYGLACLAAIHTVPLYVAAPWSTVDLACASGDAIVIERRDAREVLCFGDARVAPEGVAADNPAFDVTPARLVRAIVTERGVAAPPDERSLGALALDAVGAR